MTNLDRARAAFERWASQYETTDHPERPCGGKELLSALHACGVSDHTQSLWCDDKGRVVELLRFAEADVSAYDVLAVFRYGDRVLHSPRPDFLRTFKPLGGGEDQQLRRDGK